jgi:lipid-binding SYLF domain-containing protein
MRATGIAVIPTATRDGTHYYGKGVMSARGARQDSWTPPAVIAFDGDVPLNLEAATLALVIVAQSRRGLDCLMEARYRGARAIAAGAIGHNTMPSTNVDLLAYAQFDNFFAGVTIDRWELEEVTASNAALYGRPYSTYEIVRGAGFFHLPITARRWREALAAYFREMT